MATKKGKRSTSSKKSAASETTAKQTKKSQTTTEPTEVEEVVEVIEIEAPVAAKKSSAAAKMTISEKLTALNPSALIAELVGTFVLTAAFIKLINNSYFGLLGLALVLIVNVMIFVKISGAHFNPAITLAQWICRKINGVKAVAYIVAQVLGAILAFFVLTGINNAGYDYEATVRQGVESAGITDEVLEEAGGYDAWIEAYGGVDSVANQLGITKEAPKLYQYNTLTEGKEWVALLAEVLGTIFVGFGAAFAYAKRKDNKIAAGLAMGVSLITGLVIAGSTTILNPAIATTMGVFTWGSFAAVAWPIVVYVLGAIAGTTLGFFVYNMLVKNEKFNAEAIEL